MLVDFTPIDLLLRGQSNPSRRAILTVMVDAYSDKILAFDLSFEQDNNEGFSNVDDPTGTDDDDPADGN